MNCFIFAVVVRATHAGSSFKASLEQRGPGGVFPHFYVVLSDGETILEYRALKPPLPWYQQ